MRKLLLAILVTLSINASPLKAHQTMSFCYEDQVYAPYMFSEGDHRGVLIDLTRQAAKLSGLTPTYTRLPWKRCISEFERGNFDSLLVMIWNEERDKIAKFPKLSNAKVNRAQRIAISEYMIFTYEGSNLTWDGRTLEGLRHGIGAPRGYVATKMLENINASTNVPVDMSDGFRLVALERIDGYVANRLAGEQAILELELNKPIYPLEIPFLSDDLYVPVSNRFFDLNPETAKLFWQNLALQREANFDNLVEEYLRKT